MGSTDNCSLSDETAGRHNRQNHRPFNFLRFCKVIIFQSLIVVTVANNEGCPVPFKEKVEVFSSLLADEMLQTEKDWCDIGRKSLFQGDVAAIMVAGGLGTRTGSTSPKGAMNIGMPSQRTLFEIHASRLLSYRFLSEAETHPLLFVMTSPLLSFETIASFQKSDFFGLDPSRVFFFNQTEIPVEREDGSLIFETPTGVAKAPNGHGGLFEAFREAGLIDTLSQYKVDHVFVFSVDNVLTRVCDPCFIGYCIARNAQMGFKVVKREIGEPVGIVHGTKDGLYGYTIWHQLPPAVANSPESYDLADIFNLYFSYKFFLAMCRSHGTKLRYHRQSGRIRVVDRSQNKVKFLKGFKYERIIGEAARFVDRGKLAVLMVPRSEHFAPIKKGWSDIGDTPEKARSMLTAFHMEIGRKHGLILSDKLKYGDFELSACLERVLTNPVSANMTISSRDYVLDQVLTALSEIPSINEKKYLQLHRNEAQTMIESPEMGSALLDPNSIIRKKRDGENLTYSEIDAFINGFFNHEIPDYQMSALLMSIMHKGLSENEVKYLTKAMVSTGTRADLSGLGKVTVDKHSTGGVGDGVSLLLAPLMASFGLVIPMMSGRGLGHTGGTLDKIEATGARTNFSFEEFYDQLYKIGVGIIGPTENLAPVDREMYALRDVTSTVDNIGLIAASIMSKKIAEGVSVLLLDVKTGNGAFMKDLNDSLKLAQTMVAAGRAAGVETNAIITDMSQPLGVAVGNWLEIEQAYASLCNPSEAPNDLITLVEASAAEMLVHASITQSFTEALRLVKEKLNSKKPLQKFLDLIKIQGGEISIFNDNCTVSKPVAKYQAHVHAKREGFVHRIDTTAIGRIAVSLGAGRRIVTDSVDFTAGLKVFKKIGDKVKVGAILATIYTNKENEIASAIKNILSAYTIQKSQVTPPPLIRFKISEDGIHPWVEIAQSQSSCKAVGPSTGLINNGADVNAELSANFLDIGIVYFRNFPSLDPSKFSLHQFCTNHTEDLTWDSKKNTDVVHNATSIYAQKIVENEKQKIQKEMLYFCIKSFGHQLEQERNRAAMASTNSEGKRTCGGNSFRKIALGRAMQVRTIAPPILSLQSDALLLLYEDERTESVIQELCNSQGFLDVVAWGKGSCFNRLSHLFDDYGMNHPSKAIPSQKYIYVCNHEEISAAVDRFCKTASPTNCALARKTEMETELRPRFSFRSGFSKYIDEQVLGRSALVSIQPPSITWHIVVNHCKEELSWLQKLGNRFPEYVRLKLFVYEKCGSKPVSKLDVSGFDAIEWIPRKNVGFETEAYFSHILQLIEKNEHSPLENFPEYIYFLQGDPFDHIGSNLHHVNFYEFCAHLPFLNETKEFGALSDVYVIKAMDENTCAFYKLLFERECPPTLSFYAYSMFYASKSAILRHSHEFYLRAAQLINSSYSTNLPEKNSPFTSYSWITATSRYVRSNSEFWTWEMASSKVASTVFEALYHVIFGAEHSTVQQRSLHPRRPPVPSSILTAPEAAGHSQLIGDQC